MPDWSVLVILLVVGLAVVFWVKFRPGLKAPDGWVIGPIVRGKNYSEGLPLRPTRTDEGWKFTLPVGGQVDAVDTDTGPLPFGGKVRFQIRTLNSYGAVIRPFEAPESPPLVALYFQREGDNWSADGKMEFYRWYCYPTVDLNQGGGLEVSLTPDAWLAVMGTPGATKPEEFKAALAKASRIGLTFGWSGGRSHGVVTDKPVTFELVAWQVEG